MGKIFYKSIYFQDHPSENTKEKNLTMAFSEPEHSYYTQIKNLTTQEIKELIGFSSYKQLELFAKKDDRSINQTVKRLIKQNLTKIDKINGVSKKNVTFFESKEVPFQRWYSYIEGYSPNFVKSLIKSYKIHDTLIYDPFAGTGTTIFASDEENLSTVYSEINPLLQFLITTKIRILNLNDVKRKDLSNKIISLSQKYLNLVDQCEEDIQLQETYKIIFSNSRYFSNTIFRKILKLRTYVDQIKLEDELFADVFTIAILSSLLPVSLLKKAGDVRYKTAKELKSEFYTFEDVLPKKLEQMAQDIENLNFTLKRKHEFILANAKKIKCINHLEIGAIITSPPYLNGTNYFRNTKIELWFLKYLQYENDLRLFRNQVLTSGINDVKKQNEINGFDISSKCKLLDNTLIELEKKAYDSRIPIMARSYFEEMYCIFKDSRKHLIENAKILIDIGDSIFSNVHIKTDEILIGLFKDLGFKLIDHKILRKRRSRNKEILTQSLLVFNYTKKIRLNDVEEQEIRWLNDWSNFKNELPHQKKPYSKRNWGHIQHSLCSYQGKLKPAIAHHLIKTFVPENGVVLDPFSGVGTIPFEAALAGKYSYGFDISLPAYYISSAKVNKIIPKQSYLYIKLLNDFIENNNCSKSELNEAGLFGFNKKIEDYYQEATLKEILLARRFVKLYYPKTPSEMLVVSSLLHILHGNRPYALSRRSHPIIPYAPTGEFFYKNLIEKLTDKVDRSINSELPINFRSGIIFNQDSTMIWPQQVNNLDAIITSPPFYDSTRFYIANWLRIWFLGWSETDFKTKINSFVEEKQKISFEIYESIFRQSKERLKKDGVCVLHLGKSMKCDMANELQKKSKRWFKTVDLFQESVEHCENHGIRDKGTVTLHQYLVLK